MNKDSVGLLDGWIWMQLQQQLEKQWRDIEETFTPNTIAARKDVVQNKILWSNSKVPFESVRKFIKKEFTFQKNNQKKIIKNEMEIDYNFLQYIKDQLVWCNSCGKCSCGAIRLNKITDSTKQYSAW